MEAPVSPLVLSRAISQAVNEMHDASFVSAIKVLAPLPQVITLEMVKKASRCTGQIIPLN